MKKEMSLESKRRLQRLHTVYTIETKGENGVKHTRKPLHPGRSHAEIMADRDAAQQLERDILARRRGANETGTRYFCLSCEFNDFIRNNFWFEY